MNGASSILAAFLLFDAPSSVMSTSDPRAVMPYFLSASVLTVASTLPECLVSVNSRKAIIGATSTSVVGRVPVLLAVKTMSGSRTRLSRMQK